MAQSPLGVSFSGIFIKSSRKPRAFKLGDEWCPERSVGNPAKPGGPPRNPGLQSREFHLGSVLIDASETFHFFQGVGNLYTGGSKIFLFGYGRISLIPVLLFCTDASSYQGLRGWSRHPSAQNR